MLFGFNFKHWARCTLKKSNLFPFFLYLHKKRGKFNSKRSEFFQGLKFYLYNNLVSYLPIHLVRNLFLRHILGIKIGKFSFVHMGSRFQGTISIGNHSVIGRNCVLLGDITIKNNVSITAETYIFTSSHIVNSAYFECFYTKVVIEDYAWIGARAMILPGVRIGKGAILGAMSIATKNIPDYSIFAGNPAKEIGQREKELAYKLAYSPYFE